MKQLLNGTFTGRTSVPGDKSITHRALMLGALSQGTTHIKSPLISADTLRTFDNMRQLGAEVTRQGDDFTVVSKGHDHLKSPSDTIYTGNSGTTTRLITGLLAGLKTITASVEGDATIAKRPMDRVVIPLSEMGADITLKDSKYPPVNIQPAQLKPLEYKMPIASAQVKSAILFAGLFTSGETIVHETHQSRNHSELMMAQFGADITVNENTVTLKGGKDLSSSNVTVPGDISSAAFLIVLALITKGSDITIENVSLNETRSGIIDVVKMCGGDITITEHDSKGEPFGDIRVRYTEQLKPFHIDGEIIPRLIDEIPILAVLGVFADGDSTVRGAEELRFKETDRITAVVNELSKFGVNFEEYEDGFKIMPGYGKVKAGEMFKSYHDHRIIMMLIVMAIAAETHIQIDDQSAIDVSFPSFINDLERLRKDR
ncbi:3-phosphoshikimate 1-carboxyvinyltransferase [Jeotgalicoccus aerolatus]|uniref:3-phosphoshikimate 1-carboxyvinyltransferase n=1 Tax=Jeotgalicoccus aerolatus TaxID=709510 RepID=A0ABS4HLT5_9STAP|nr:3-phosphoshikimate 1-carboxyvinyltransferase [Jeotgalicoccus aerolatus]MBP1951793.1 3-phosphoshikimate 1-carboxyvinyltransferase [Jeotgalicoccus aerolatus]GGD94752.1 3-phosphoshikimate 1-carboxyvinyltransferase [Jeotgalicoccus aerolatus]CAD2075184.1 3-phosphoshikimate 1-carboxyvinyltransferase [Jeotgalicoccus aerolatus]